MMIKVNIYHLVAVNLACCVVYTMVLCLCIFGLMHLTAASAAAAEEVREEMAELERDIETQAGENSIGSWTADEKEAGKVMVELIDVAEGPCVCGCPA